MGHWWPDDCVTLNKCNKNSLWWELNNFIIISLVYVKSVNLYCKFLHCAEILRWMTFKILWLRWHNIQIIYILFCNRYLIFFCWLCQNLNLFWYLLLYDSIAFTVILFRWLIYDMKEERADEFWFPYLDHLKKTTDFR